MVLPKATTRKGSKPSATPDRSLYEAGKGNILSHFAGIATPDVSAAVVARALTGTTGTTRLRTRRSLDGLNGDLPPMSDNDLYGKSNDDVHMDSSSLVSTIGDDYSSGTYTNFVGTTDRDMEDALFGTHSGDNNNADEESKELSQKDKLDMWRKERGNNRIPMHPNSKGHAVQQQPLKRPKAAHAMQALASQPKAFDESNQSFESEVSNMFSMDFSPPRHNRSADGAVSSRRSTIEGDPAAAIALVAEDYDKVRPLCPISNAGISFWWCDCAPPGADANAHDACVVRKEEQTEQWLGRQEQELEGNFELQRLVRGQRAVLARYVNRVP